MSFQMRDLAGPVLQRGWPAGEAPCAGNTLTGDDGPACAGNTIPTDQGGGAFAEPPLDALRQQLRASLS
jgi:hypothetical protein